MSRLDTERFELELSNPGADADEKRWMIQVLDGQLSVALVNDAGTTAEVVTIERRGVEAVRISYRDQCLTPVERTVTRQVIFAATEEEAEAYRQRMLIPLRSCIVIRNVGDVQTLFKRNSNLNFVGAWSSNREVYEAYLELMRRPE